MRNFAISHNQGDLRRYAAGEVIFQQGDTANFLYDVIKGEIALSRNDKVIARLDEGEIFGETALINHEPHSVTAIAVVDSQVAVISKQRFEFMVTETPNFAMRVMSVLAGRLNQETAKHQ